MATGRQLTCRLARRRAEMGLTQEQLARKVGCGQPTVSDIERRRAAGPVDPKLSTIVKVAAAMGLAVELVDRKTGKLYRSIRRMR